LSTQLSSDTELYGDGVYRGGERGWPGGAQGQLAVAALGMDGRGGQNLDGEDDGSSSGGFVLFRSDGTAELRSLSPSGCAQSFFMSFFYMSSSPLNLKLVKD
jgi:hypothetical protein